MNLLKFYKYIIFSLVGLNMIVLAFFLLAKPHPIHQPPPKNFQAEVIKIFGLDNQQASVFKELSNGHKQRMKEIDEQQEKLLLPYFGSLTNASKSTDKESLLNQFQQLEREKIEVTYRHFEEIKKLLNKKQLPEFEEFMKNITNKLLSGEKKKSPSTEGF